jgi:hypothetical protein
MFVPRFPFHALRCPCAACMPSWPAPTVTLACVYTLSAAVFMCTGSWGDALRHCSPRIRHKAAIHFIDWQPPTSLFPERPLRLSVSRPRLVSVLPLLCSASAMPLACCVTVLLTEFPAKIWAVSKWGRQ